MKESLRAGLIGCGGLGRVHTQALQELDGMDMVAFCDVNLERARAFKAQYGGQHAGDDPDDLFRDETLDAIYICTWHDTHADLCTAPPRPANTLWLRSPWP